ncbi:hypothetical protein LMG31506_04855 [Cupriavidus yeoncheonensis]|uniref:Radical SAM core domain-containing protein n=1 Tax=Cupriavidus yeoncheonensis TaxID=1462994 RepID=A0A916IZF2_9BURK|nr:hypothetical protein LMG31506_04855 [Cupriavidus yeoncheonensis]
MLPQITNRTNGQETRYILSRYIVATDPVLDKNTNTTHIIIFSTRSLRALLVSPSVWNSISSTNIETLDKNILEVLLAAKIIVSPEDNELEIILQRNRAAIASSQTLYECLQPTALCQLGCDYCGQSHRPDTLSHNDQDTVVERIAGRLRQGSYTTLEIGWFGGEPLLGMNAIRRLTPLLQNASSLQQCKYRARVVTNGLRLSKDIATELVCDLGVDEIEVTLDGPADSHDARRHTKGGKPTFARIFENVEWIVKSSQLPVNVTIRCNVDRRNADSVSRLIDQLADLESQDRMSLYFAPIHSWGNDADALCLSREEYAHLEMEWLSHAYFRRFSPPLMPGPKPIVCMAVNPHAELIDPFGNVFNCTEAPMVPAYGEINFYSRGTVRIPEESPHAVRLGAFLDDIAKGRFDCASCPMLPVCGGACPKQWNDGHIPCPSAKLNIKDRLILAWAFSRIDHDTHST